MLLLVGACILNLVISFLNARAAGQIWAESKAVGGWVRALVWSAVIQSAIGFTSVYAVIAAYIAVSVGYFTQEQAQMFSQGTYVLLIIPSIGSGLVITLQSWINLAREKSLRSLGIAGWNTFAQVYNTYRAVTSFSSAFKGISGAFKSRDRKNANVLILIILVAALGCLTTYGIVQKYAGTLGVPKDVVDMYVSDSVRSKKRKHRSLRELGT